MKFFKQLLMAVIAMVAILVAAPVAFADEWIERDKGYVYEYDDGTIAKPGWLTVGNKKYYITKDGTRKTGWLKTTSGDKYFFDKNGIMVVNNIVKKGDNYYYFDESGKMKTGWVDLKYLKNFYYVFDYENLYIADGRHYFRSDGTMLYNGFLKSGENTYGFDEFGVQQVNKFGMVKGKVYKFDKKGYRHTAVVKSVDTLKDYLNEGYNRITLPSGSFSIRWIITEGDKSDDPYNYSIMANVAPEDFLADYHKTKSVLSDNIWELSDPEKYSDKEREQANKILQNYILTSVKTLLKFEPEAKVEAKFYESWHTYAQTWRVYSNEFHSQYWLTCRNYETSDKNSGKYGYTEYKRTKVTKLRWIGSPEPCYKRVSS